MTETVELKPCPFCSDPMRVKHSIFGHVDQGKCIIGALAWDLTFVPRCNTRSDPAVRDKVTDEMVEVGAKAVAEFDGASDWKLYKSCTLEVLTAALRTFPPEPASGADMSTGWLIHKAGRGWYLPEAAGYTNDPKQAGRYSRKEAESYSHPNGWSGPRDGMTLRHESELTTPPAKEPK